LEAVSQALTHEPPDHTGVAPPHTTPHPPQLLVSDVRSTHAELPASWLQVAEFGGSQSHVPFSHVSPLQHPSAQLSPFAPQIVHSEFAHVPLQHSENAAHGLPPGLH